MNADLNAAVEALLVMPTIGALGVTWRVYARSLHLWRHPVHWALFLVAWTALWVAFLAAPFAFDMSARQRIVPELQAALYSWYGYYLLRRMLRRPWAPAGPYGWSKPEKHALWLATGVVLSGFMLVAGFLAFAALRGSTSPLTVENDTGSQVQVLVANGCSRDSSLRDNRPIGFYILELRPGQVGHARRARGDIGPDKVLGFVSGNGAQRCLISLDGGAHALVSQAPPCPTGLVRLDERHRAPGL